MPNSKCSCCHSAYVVTKAIELRQINTLTMSLASSRRLLERECLQCGHIDIIEPETLSVV